MSNILPLPDLNNLADRITDIISETGFDVKMKVIEAKHAVGREIVEDLLYKKYAKGSGGLVRDLANILDRSESDLYACVQFFEVYPNLSTAVETLAPGTKQHSWTTVKKALAAGGKVEVCEHEWVERTITKCGKCGRRS